MRESEAALGAKTGTNDAVSPGRASALCVGGCAGGGGSTVLGPTPASSVSPVSSPQSASPRRPAKAAAEPQATQLPGGRPRLDHGGLPPGRQAGGPAGRPHVPARRPADRGPRRRRPAPRRQRRAAPPVKPVAAAPAERAAARAGPAGHRRNCQNEPRLAVGLGGRHDRQADGDRARLAGRAGRQDGRRLPRPLLGRGLAEAGHGLAGQTDGRRLRRRVPARRRRVRP